MGAPDCGGGFPFGGTGVVDAKATSRHGDVELGRPDIGPGVGRLHNHCLARDSRTCKSELVACAAVRRASTDGCEAVGKAIAHGPGTLGRAHVGSTTSTAGSDVCTISDGFVIDITDFDWRGERGRRPGAGWFAAVPVACCGTGTRGLRRDRGCEGCKERRSSKCFFVRVHFGLVFEYR